METLDILYGTAWKEDATERLVALALEAGFRSIDTANQRKHYHEAAVGRALRAAFAQGLKRETVFVQTKFTFSGGQDARLPYERLAPIAKQVEQSCASSLDHLGVDCVDSYLLHGPWSRSGWGPNDAEAWSAMESLCDAGRVAALGISNVSLEQLEALCSRARIAPAYVQNRCYARTGWDAQVRRFCLGHGIRYQGFSLLTANGQVLGSRVVQAMAQRHGKTPAQLVFGLAHQLGMLPLTGTTDPEHMLEDLAALRLRLTPAEVAELDRAW